MLVPCLEHYSYSDGIFKNVKHHNMKRCLWVLLLFLLSAAGRLQAQIASFSFAGPDSAAGWTNVSGDPVHAQQTATAGGIMLSSVGTGNWSRNTQGNCALNNGGESNGSYFPAAVMANSWIQYNGSGLNLALYNAAVPQIELTGLNPDSTYILRMTGSTILNYPSTTQYTVAGATVSGSQQLNPFDNITQGVTFRGVQPDTSGMIRVYVNPTAGNLFAWICGLQVFPGSANIGTPVVALTAPTNGTVQSEGGNFIITATASEIGSTIAKVEFYADTTKIGEADAAPYTMTWVDPDPGSYQLTAKATDAGGTIVTASVNVGVQSLNYFWSLTGNAGNNGDSNFVGTVDSTRLPFRTRNIEHMNIGANGTITVGQANGHDTILLRGPVKIPAGATAGYVLTSDTSGNASWQPGSGGRWLYANGTVFDTTDNIAIGTSNPQGYKLAVNGSGIFTKIVAKPKANWPDYVFGKNYQLMSLQEVAQYIQTHHHLPDVTPEAEIMRDGIDLGAEQTSLLKKIEELTLYLIHENQSLSEQNKQLSEQNARLEAQQKEIDELKALIRADHKQ
jgi:hypothetical protein